MVTVLVSGHWMWIQPDPFRVSIGILIVDLSILIFLEKLDSMTLEPRKLDFRNMLSTPSASALGSDMACKSWVFQSWARSWLFSCCSCICCIVQGA